VAGDEHAAVGDLEEAVAQAELDRLAGEPGADVVARRLEADRPATADEAGERPQSGRRFLLDPFQGATGSGAAAASSKRLSGATMPMPWWGRSAL
jgi:hypothetical protein